MNQSLSKLGKQLLDIWKQLGVSQRITVALATLAVLAGLLGMSFWASRANYALLYGRLSDAEAAKVVAALDDSKTQYKTGSGGAIYVPADKVHVTRMQLAGKGIPRGDGVGFEIFDKPNFGISDFVQRANYVRAVQGELSRTISQLDEVDAARVMIVLPETRLFMDKDKHPTASVFIRARGNNVLPSRAVDSIRFLVANSVEGLKPNYVTVVDNQGNVLSENSDEDSMAGLTTAQLAARRNLEQYLAKKAEGMLEKVLGPGQAIVRVAAEINLDTVSRTEEKFDPEGQVVRSETKNDENNDTSRGANGEAVGISANTASSTNLQGGVSTSTSRNKRTTGNVEYEISKSTSNHVQAGGGIRRLSAAVTIAARYEGAGVDRKLAPRQKEELDKLLRIVQSALGNDISRGDQITLEELPFNEQFATEVAQQLQKQEKSDFIWSVLGNLTYPAMAIIALVVLMRLLKKTPVETIPLGIPMSQLSRAGVSLPGSGPLGNGIGNRPGVPRWDSEEGAPRVTVDVLNQLVRENPGNMTQALRTWLTRGNAQPEALKRNERR